MATVIEQILKKLPADAKVVSYSYEGANIVLYTKSTTFFKHGKEIIHQLVDEFKKRIDLRADASILLDEEKTKELIKKTIPKDAEVTNINLEPARSLITIEAKNPGSAIGKAGSLLRLIREQTYWSPIVKRDSVIPSTITKRIRNVIYEDSRGRRKFLDDVGKRIYEIKKRPDAEPWVRVSFLGGARQVGRSCFLLQTPESKILLDCGIDPATDKDSFPILNAPEFNIQDLDAVIVSHSHLDHCLPPETPVQLADGTVKPIDDVQVGEELLSVDWETGKEVTAKCSGKLRTKAHKSIYKIKTPYSTIEASPNHRFFIVENLELKEVKAGDLKKGQVITTLPASRAAAVSAELKPIDYRERLSLPITARQELRAIRCASGLTQYATSEQIGSSINYINSLENRYDYIYNDYFNKLSEFYGFDKIEFMNKFGMQRTYFPSRISEELAQCVGYIAGDGHASSDYSIRATDESIACLEAYKQKIKSVFNHESIIRPHSDPSKNAHWLEINNAGILRFLRLNFEEAFNKSRETLVPSSILYGPREVVCGFLRGIADAKGCVKTSGITIASCSNSLLEQMQYLLSSVGIPSNINYKDHIVGISSKLGLSRFAERIGFSHPKKHKKLIQLIETLRNKTERLHEVFPVSSEDLKQILIKTRIKGRAQGSIKIASLPSGILDLYRRGGTSCAERKTLANLLSLLEGRLEELNSLKNANIREKRISLALTIEKLSKLCGATYMQIQLCERRGFGTAFEKIEQALNDVLSETIVNTSEIIKKIKKIARMPILWQRISKIEEIANPYPYLVDIEVDPTQNFIANNVVVHNCGMVPYLYKYGYTGPVYCTAPTRDVMALLQLDYINVCHSKAQEPPYSSNDIQEMVKHTIILEYGVVTDITPDIRVTLYNAGHILGSSLVHLHLGEGWYNLLYTGDFKTKDSMLLDGAHKKFPRVETLITESTYGGKEDIMPPRKECADELRQVILETVKRGGKVLVPVLGSGRAQEVSLIVEELVRKEKLNIPVYVDGMVWDITALHEAYPEFLNSELRKKIFYKDKDPFTSGIFKQVGSAKERQLVLESGPCVILATSGMLVGGPSVTYLSELAQEKKNSLVFVSYQGEGSLGAKIQRGERSVILETNKGNKRVEIKMRVHMISGLSGHSDRNELISYVHHMSPMPHRIIVVHGEKSKCLNLASTLHKTFNVETTAPRLLDAVRLK